MPFITETTLFFLRDWFLLISKFSFHFYDCYCYHFYLSLFMIFRFLPKFQHLKLVFSHFSFLTSPSQVSWLPIYLTKHISYKHLDFISCEGLSLKEHHIPRTSKSFCLFFEISLYLFYIYLQLTLFLTFSYNFYLLWGCY